jgi:hypothetical protein
MIRVGTPAEAQTSEVERTFPQSQAEIERAIEKIRYSTEGRLPILDGFVGSTSEPLESYKNGYFRCSMRVVPAPSGGTLVRVVAKISAWYSDPNQAQSGYRTLASNGRLEADLLDRLADVLSLGAGEARRETRPMPASSSRLPQAPAVRASPAVAPPASLPGDSAEPEATVAAGSALTDNTKRLDSKTEEAAPLTLDRQQAEKRIKDLNDLARNLQEILHNQAHPTDLAAVRKSGTPVYARPQTTATILFAAEAEDEFEILETRPAWVHVHISGVSRGWIRRAHLEMPDSLVNAKSGAGDADGAGGVTFRVSREVTKVFSGDWEPLRGKTVRVIWVEGVLPGSSSPLTKREFAKSLLLAAYQKFLTAESSIAGIVVVFDSADGGQIAATLADLKRLKDGSLSDAAFWQQCSLDPPESFRNNGKP